MAELESLAAEPNFWDKPDKAEALLKETKREKAAVEGFDNLAAQLADAETLLELAQEAGDEGEIRAAGVEADAIAGKLADLELSRMLSGEHDSGGAIVEINAGAGGIDAADWAQMILRMMLRYCQRKGFSAEVLDEQPAEEAGIKSATIAVAGESAYGLLKAERGVHRLVRISPFDQNARRQTSFAAVGVMPDIDEAIEVDLPESDLRIDVYRASGAGGQHVNKTESAVRITHLPTGVVVQCQNERSQHKNKAHAMRVLRSRIYALKEQERAARDAGLAGEKKKIEWGSQIRSYVLAPYRQVSDHRTELKIGNVDAVLDGDLDELIRAYLLSAST
ncbi:MAG TPA: peptide chain release factor 2 [Kofleriaceae bacterium]|nr:peptide chain release factor 2 [Kofleriaceae bacterium]